MVMFGFDESAEQNGLRPSQVPGDFVHIKCTGGDGYVNPFFRQQLADAKAAGKRSSLYHFARDGYTNATPASEAAWFLKNAADVFDGTVLPVLDWEADNKTDTVYCKSLLDGMRAGIDIRPVLYADYGTITSGADWSAVAALYKLWEAAYVAGYQKIYGYNPPNGLADIPFWGAAGRIEWQFTSSGLLSGWPNVLDLDEFFGTPAQWDALCQKEDDDMVNWQDTNALTSKDGIKVSPEQMFNSMDAKDDQILAALAPLASFIVDVRGDLANKGAELDKILAQEDPAKIAAAIPADMAQKVIDALAARLKTAAP